MGDTHIDMQPLTDRLSRVAQALTEFSAALAFTSLASAERWVAGLPRRHFADPELLAPPETAGGEHA